MTSMQRREFLFAHVCVLYFVFVRLVGVQVRSVWGMHSVLGGVFVGRTLTVDGLGC